MEYKLFMDARDFMENCIYRVVWNFWIAMHLVDEIWFNNNTSGVMEIEKLHLQVVRD
ncbi:MAG: hypothetical protein ACLTZT_05935 [Butyricimonas faecalis]